MSLERTALERWRFRLLGLGLLVFFVTHALVPQAEVLAAVGVLVVGLVVLAMAREGVGWIGLVVALLAPVVVGAFLGAEVTAVLAGSGYQAPLYIAAACIVGDRVLHTEHADEDAIIGSLCVYLLTAIAFASLYEAIEVASPGAFSFATAPSETDPFGACLYYSLVTITTLGYGDTTPVHPLAQGLTSVQAVFAVLYPAIVVSRIVALAVDTRTQPFALPVGRTWRERFGFPALAGTLLLSLLMLPLSGSGSFGHQLFQGLITLQIVVALVVIPGERATQAAWGLGAATLLVGWSGDASGSWLHGAAQLGRTLFFMLGSALLVRWLWRETEVTREVLLACVAVYLMVGFSLAGAFGLVEALQPGAIYLPEGQAAEASTLVYFAFMTLTTTGFGEIHPAAAAAGHVASFGAIFGVFYPVAVIARLVSLYRD